MRILPEHVDSLAGLAAERLQTIDHTFDEDAFRAGVEASLESGAFIFVYCGRNLDERTRRIMTYLAEGPKMTFFAVEVDYFREDASDNAVLVPRTAFIPSWITAPDASHGASSGSRHTLADAPPQFSEVVARMDEVADALRLTKSQRRTGWSYLPPTIEEGVQDAKHGIGVYASSRGVEFNLTVLGQTNQSEVSAALRDRLNALTNSAFSASSRWPSISHEQFLTAWPRMRDEVIVPYFRTRMAASTEHSAR